MKQPKLRPLTPQTRKRKRSWRNEDFSSPPSKRRYIATSSLKTRKRKRTIDNFSSPPSKRRHISTGSLEKRTAGPDTEDEKSNSTADPEPSQGTPLQSVLEKDIWVTAYQHNQERSPFFRLPNELIAIITSHLSETSKYVLHQSSRRFRGFYSEQGFTRANVAGGRGLIDASKSFGEPPPQVGDDYQTTRSRGSRSSGTPLTSPYGHSVTFPGLVMSPLNPMWTRNVSRTPVADAPKKYENEMFKYDPFPAPDCNFEVLDKSISRFQTTRELGPLIRKDLYCQPCLTSLVTPWRQYHRKRLEHPLHCSGCDKNHPNALFSIGQRSKGDKERICIGREGYVRLCPHKTVSWLDIEAWLASRTGENSTVFTCEHESHGSKTPTKDTSILQPDRRPTLRISSRSDFRDVIASLQWQVNPLDMKAEEPATVAHIRAKLRMEELAATTTLCPHESFDDVTFLLRPFDPYHCACTQAKSGLTPNHDKTNTCESGLLSSKCTTCCRCLSAEWGGLGQGRLLATRRLPKEPHQPVGEVNHKVTCNSCPTSYTWSKSDNVVELSRRTMCGFRSPYEHSWISMLDPASYDTKEPGSLHTLWCEDPKCATARQWKKQVLLATITKALQVEGQWGEQTPEERERQAKATRTLKLAEEWKRRQQLC